MSRSSTSEVPLIGITADTSDVTAKRAGGAPEPTLFLPQRYCRAVHKAGGIPLILPPVGSRSTLRKALQHLHGIMVSGGNFDIHPSYYGEKPIRALGAIKRERTMFELEIIDFALNQDLPLLGICGGAQAINVALGGSLYQDIATELPNASQHEQGANHGNGRHPIEIYPGTRLWQIVRRQTLEVNTTHHQAVRKVGQGLRVNAKAKDGLIEGIESCYHRFVLGVQWHPEALVNKDVYQRRILSAFIAAAKHRRSGF